MLHRCYTVWLSHTKSIFIFVQRLFKRRFAIIDKAIWLCSSPLEEDIHLTLLYQFLAILVTLPSPYTLISHSIKREEFQNSSLGNNWKYHSHWCKPTRKCLISKTWLLCIATNFLLRLIHFHWVIHFVLCGPSTSLTRPFTKGVSFLLE
jgi:hypothetical protein